MLNIETQPSNSWVNEAYKKIESRINSFSVPTIRDAVLACTKDDRKTDRVVSACTAALRAVYFFDFHAESRFRFATSEKERKDREGVYLKEAQRQLEICYGYIHNKKYRNGAKKIVFNISKLFKYERNVWEKVKFGEKVESKDIEQVWKMKSSDAILYGFIIKSLMGKDFGPVLYANMRLLDIRGDLLEISKDIAENSPNMIVAMITASGKRLDKIPTNDSEIIDLAKQIGVDDKIIGMVKRIKKTVSRYDLSVKRNLGKKNVAKKDERFIGTFCDSSPGSYAFDGYTSIRRRMDDNEEWINRSLSKTKVR